MITDLLKKPLLIGDYVVVTRKNYRDMVIGIVYEFTPKQARVVYKSSGTSGSEEYLTSELIKIEPNDHSSIPKQTIENLQKYFSDIKNR